MRPAEREARKGRDTIPPPETESNAGGAGRLSLLLALGAASLLAFVLLLRGPGPPPPHAAPVAGPAEAFPAEPSAPALPDAAAEARRGGPERTLEGEPPPGKGRIRVFLVDPPEGPRRTECAVSIGPTALILSAGKGVERSAVVPSGGDRCAFEDLPDAAYLVRATGEGLSPVETPIAIGASEGRDVAVRLVLRRAVFVDGWILDEEGTALEGVAVRLEPERGGTLPLETRSDAAGRYRIDGVVSGAYRLLVGPREKPFVEPVRVAIEDSPLRHDVRLGILGSLEVTVVDEEGRPLEAKVDGFGPPGGTFHGETTPDGVHLARNLPAGDYRVVARAERHGVRFEEARVAARETARVRVVLRRAR